MNAFFTYIFKHQYYKRVIASYNEAITKYANAYLIWLEHEGRPNAENFSFKETVASNLPEIKRIKTWINTSETILNNKKHALLWFFNERGLTSIPDFHYNEYKLVAENNSYIRYLQVTLETYGHLSINHKDAIDRYLQTSKNTYSYDEIKQIVSSKEVIETISTVLSKAKSLRTKHCVAWNLFAKGRNFNDIPISELESLNEEDFERKETFLSLYNKEPELIKLILGSSFLPIESFEQATLDQEEEVIVILASRDINPIEQYSANIRLENPLELKRAVLDSVKYGKSCDFTDSYTISQFYKLRADFDRIGVSFDSAVWMVMDNHKAIKSYNLKKYGQCIIYNKDYLESVTEGSPLALYIKTYKEGKYKRDEAKRINAHYPKGFSAIFGELDLDICSLQYIEAVINAKSQIQKKDNELERIERKRLEAERKKKETIRKQQEIHDLKSCVSSWSQPHRSSIKYFSLYNYYPMNCDWDASESEWFIRTLIWDFKAKPHNYQSTEEIMRRHCNSVDILLPKLCKVLRHYFGNKVPKLTIVPVLASTRIVSDRRYADIMERICNELDMYNGYLHVTITTEGISKNDPTNNTGHSIPPEVEYEPNFFKDKYVILFDDVITSGASMERCKCLLEASGATVIGGLSIGKTKHERQSSNPIDNINMDIPF